MSHRELFWNAAIVFTVVGPSISAVLGIALVLAVVGRQ
jgi:hypothetical protein